MPKTERNIDVQALRDLFISNAVAKAMFDHFATRQKKSSETKTDRMIGILQQDGRRVFRSDVIAVFRQLEYAGCGEYVEGRHGHPSRFVWLADLCEVGRAANGSAAAVSPLPPDASAAEEEDSLLPHDFRLRPGLVLRFELPSDLTVAEAGRISDYVRTLPFS